VDDGCDVVESVARCFSVLGEPARLRILQALCHEERCVNEIIQITALAQANVSRHLGLMHQIGMLSRRREGTQIFYKVADPMYVELCRTVSRRLAGRIDAAALARGGRRHFVEPNAPRQSPEATAERNTPANPKEEASV